MTMYIDLLEKSISTKIITRTYSYNKRIRVRSGDMTRRGRKNDWRVVKVELKAG